MTTQSTTQSCICTVPGYMPGVDCKFPHPTRRVGWRAPTYNELARALRLAHEHHGFGPEHCTPANCSAAEALARLRSRGAMPDE